jgi:hypothetical protein
MRTHRKAAAWAIVLAVSTVVLASCGSDGEGTTVAQPPPVPPDTAANLAKLSDRVASDLDSGDTCHAAHAADDLSAAVEEADLPVSMRSDVDEVTGRLVDEVNCPPPPPPPEPEKKKKEEKDKEHKEDEHGKDHEGDSGFVPPGQAKHGGVGPGKAKLKGGEFE